MFPLLERKIIRGGEAHIKAGLGLATDYVADYVGLFCPFDGVVEAWGGDNFQGGNWLNLVRSNGDIIQFAHLSKYKTGGATKEGELIAITGNTGTITTGPHSHIQIKDKDGNRLDPETYDWETEKNITDKKMMRLIRKQGDKRVWAVIGDMRYWILDSDTLNRGLTLWGDWNSVIDDDPAKYRYGGAIFISYTDDPLEQ